jgi:signal transduction histidine kinase/HD-like signal output (HDOD) protein
VAASQYTLHDLPATSQVLFEVLELCQHPKTSAQQLAASIMLDPVLCSTLLSMTADQVELSNTETGLVEQVVERLGMAAVQSVTLDIARRLCQQPQSTEQQAFNARLWRRMILSAKLASAFAILTQYSNPGEAYIAGLLQGMGHLRVIAAAAAEPGLLRMDSDEQAIVAAERDLFSEDHCQWAYQLVKAWGMPGFLADALRYQNYSAEQVADAHPLVRLSSLAGQLASPRFEVVNQGLDMAHQLYGINPTLCEEILSQARAETQRAAAELAIQAQSDFSPQPLLALGRLVDDLLQIQTIFSSLNADESAGLEPRKVFARVLGQAVGCKQFRILLHDAKAHRLVGFSDGGDALVSDDQNADWQISLQPARSAMAMSFSAATTRMLVTGDETHSVADQQILDMLQQPAALCLPVIVDADTGLLVVAGGSKEAIATLAARNRYLQLLCAILARLLSAQWADTTAPPDDDLVREADMSMNVREIIHEVSNPLNIVGNYLSILKHKLDQQGSHYSELDIMAEELQRAVRLMRGWGAPSEPSSALTSVDVNQLLTRLLQVYRATMIDAQDIELSLELDPGAAEVRADAGAVQQIVRNLLSNAIEAVGQGGHIRIKTIAAVYMDSGDYVALVVADDGPGIVEEVRQNIFKPVQSTKGDGHSGLGLSIVKSLVDKLQGKIAFRTAAAGTEFQVYLPK